MDINKYFVYALFKYESTIPLYIGHGSGRRLYNSTRSICKRYNLKYHSIVPIIIEKDLFQKDAVTMEEELISLYGRQVNMTGVLLNVGKCAHGGFEKELNPMYKMQFSKETKLKMSKAKLGKKLSLAHKKAISDGISKEKHPLYGKKHSESSILKMKQSALLRVNKQHKNNLDI